MKKFLLSLAFFAPALMVWSQENNVIKLPTDKNGKIEFTEVADQEGIKADSLKKKAIVILNQWKNISDVKVEGNSVTANGFEDFIGGAKKQKMKMSYGLKIDFKDNRYKITFSKIEYTPYPDANNPTQMTTPAESWYGDYQLLIGKGKENSSKAKIYYHIFNTTSRDIEALKMQLIDAMGSTVPEGDDW